MLTAEALDEILDRAFARHIGARVGAQAAKMPGKRKPRENTKRDRCIAMFRAGYEMDDIAAAVPMHPFYVRMVLRKAGLTKRGRRA